MLIEFTNAIEPRTHASVSVAIVVAACAFFFIPTTLIVLGYYSSQPTGTLISPLPQGVLTSVTPTVALTSAPVIAAPGDSTNSTRSAVTPTSDSNVSDLTATLPAGAIEASVTNPDIKATSQIYLSPRNGDNTTYSVKSKSAGAFILTASTQSDTLRYIDYHIVNP